MTPDALLDVRGIRVVRGGRALVDDVTFAVARAEVVGVIGPNGAGKTTLFEAIAGLLEVDGGTVRRAPLFYLPDGIRPWAEQRVSWTLDFFAKLSGGSVDGRAVEALELGRLMPQRIASLSKGETKRLALALALSTPQEVLLLDEPFDGLDFKQTRSAIDLLRGCAAAGRTLILSIHQLVDAARVCDRFLLLDHGRAIAHGTIDELQARVGNPGASLEEVFLALE